MMKDNPVKFFYRGFILALVLLLAACGGSGDGNSSPGEKTVEGKALVPTTDVSYYHNQSIKVALVDFLFPLAGAAITGLEPVPGALVELVEVDDNGVQVGDVLASTHTSVTGDYKLSLPSGLDFAANLIVRISGTGADMRAQVVEQEVDITPLTEYILQKLIDNGTKLTELAVNEVVNLTGHAEQFDIAATSDLTSMLEQLEAELGNFVDTTLDIINNKPGMASSIAGDVLYAYAGTGFKFMDDPVNSWSSGSQSLNYGSGEAAFLDDGEDSIGIQQLSENDIYTESSTGDNSNYYLWFENNIGTSNDIVHNVATIDSDSNIFFTFPFEESIWSDASYGTRIPPTTEISYFSGVDGVWFSTPAEHYAIYHLNEAKDAVDPAAKVGHAAQFGLSNSVSASTGLSTDDITGKYGVVYFNETITRDGTYSVESGVIDTTISNGDVTEDSKDASHIVYLPNRDGSGTAVISELTESATDTGTLTVNSNGSLTYDSNGNSLTYTGHSSKNAEIVTLISSDSITDTEMQQVTLAITGQAYALKKPSSKPDLSNRTYRLMGIEKYMLANGDMSIQRYNGDKDRLSFNSGALAITVTIDGFDVIAQPSNSEDFVYHAADVSRSYQQLVNIGDDGAISFSESITNATRTWKGYVSESGNIIILSVKSALDDGSSKSAGIYVAVPVN